MISSKTIWSARWFPILVVSMFTLLIYWPGLSGPYLFDDFWNLSPIERWMAGEISWKQSLTPNTLSLIDSRPLAMGSFMLSTWIGGIGAFPSKLGNLILHVASGWLVWRVALRLIPLDGLLRKHASSLALVLTAIWLLHPLHVSTVLYAVQRMSQLSTISALLCVLTYLSARDSLESGQFSIAVAKLFLLFPTLLILGILGKQNAVIASALCLAIEIVLPHASMTIRSKKILGLFFILFLALPAISVLVYLSLHPGYILDGYRDWDFTLQQRLLTQARVVVDYISSILVPYSPGMGLYTDDFPVSTSMLKPASTLLAIFALLGITASAFWKRASYPLAFVGWLFFLIAHSVEASILPLEMYYEHRNYLPSIGLLLAVTGLLGPLVARSIAQGRASESLVTAAALALVSVLAVATLGRVLIWQSFDTIVAQGVLQHPRSIRAASDAAWIALERQHYNDARTALRPLAESDDRRARIFGRLQWAALDCYEGRTLDTSNLDLATSEAMSKTTVYETQVIRMFDNATLFGQCKSIPHVFAAASQRILDAAVDQPETNRNKAVSREVVARLYARGGEWTRAEQQARLSWGGSRNPPTGALLVHIYLHNRKLPEAKLLVAKLGRLIPAGDMRGQAALRQLRARIAAAENR